MRVIGVDSSTQSTKAVLVDASDGRIIETRQAPHPPGTEVDPRAWLTAYDATAGELVDQAAAIGVGGQQHGMVALDSAGQPVRDALLWNDTRSAPQARDLIAEIGGPAACATAIGSVLVASFTATKLRWLREVEPDNAARVAQVLLPHDYVSLHVAAPGSSAFTDRGDASGTGYFDSVTNTWRDDLVTLALGHRPDLPTVVAPGAIGAQTASGAVISAGTGDNMAAALGMGLGPGDILISIGTSGVVSAISPTPITDPTGTVTGFADATGHWLPMVTTMNAAGVLDLQRRWLGVGFDEFDELALSAAPGASGVTILGWYGGERTPNRPDATGAWGGLTPRTTRADLARAAVEALACSLADALDELTTRGVRADRVLAVGGATRSRAVRQVLPGILGRPVLLPPPGEYVALGAARQAAWALAGTAEPSQWDLGPTTVVEADPTPDVRAAYAAWRTSNDRPPTINGDAL